MATEQKISPAIDTRRMESLTDGAKLAIVLCVGAYAFGGNWGYIRREDDLQGKLELIREEKGNVNALRARNGALVIADPNFLAYNVNAIVPNAINSSFVELAKKRKEEERTAFMKFLKSVAEGKSRFTKGQNGRYTFNLGIYSINETNLIRQNGIEYPAYKISLNEALGHLAYLAKEGYKVVAHALDENGNDNYDTPFNLGSNSRGLKSIYRGLELADTGTGVFLKVGIAAK